MFWNHRKNNTISIFIVFSIPLIISFILGSGMHASSKVRYWSRDIGHLENVKCPIKSRLHGWVNRTSTRMGNYVGNKAGSIWLEIIPSFVHNFINGANSIFVHALYSLSERGLGACIFILEQHHQGSATYHVSYDHLHD